MPTTANKMKNSSSIGYNNNNNDDEDDDEATTHSNFVPIKKANKNKKPAIEYNNRTELSYRQNNLTTPDNLDYQEKNFLSKVDATAGIITRTVTKIVRMKAIDYSSPKMERKEYLIYYENWSGRD